MRKRLSASMFGNVTPHLFLREYLDKVGGFPNDGAGPGDLETYLKLLTVTDVCFMDIIVARYRSHSGGFSGKTFGLRECSDYIRMVEKLSGFFAGRTEIPIYLMDDRFLREWKVWAAGHNILASYQRKWRMLPNQFDDIRKLYFEKNLSSEFNRFLRNNSVGYIAKTLYMKFRRFLDLPLHPNLFSEKDLRQLSK